MIKRIKWKLWEKVSVIVFIIFLFFSFHGKTISRYYNAFINNSDLSLAPWVISINNQKITSAGEVDIIVNPVVTETTTVTKTYKNKIVPGCKGYFDMEINPEGTGVALDYIIDFNLDNLPGGMTFTKYEILDENKVVTETYNILPSNDKIIGTMSLIDGNLLGRENTLRYRIYWDYVDDDALNTTAPNVNNQNTMIIKVILKHSIK